MTNWKRTIDKSLTANIRKVDNDEISKEKGLLNIAAILKSQPEYKEQDKIGEGELWDIVDEMEWVAQDNDGEAVTYDDFNALLGAMYDWADYEKIWIELSL